MVSGDRQVIGKFRIFLSLYAATGMVLGLIFCVYVFHGRLTGEIKGISVFSGALAAFFMILALAPLTVKVLRQFLSDERNALWLDDENMIFVHPSHLAIPRASIVDVRLDTDRYGYERAVIALRDGGKKAPLLHYVNAKPGVIVARMRAALGLPDDPDACKVPEG